MPLLKDQILFRKAEEDTEHLAFIMLMQTWYWQLCFDLQHISYFFIYLVSKFLLFLRMISHFKMFILFPWTLHKTFVNIIALSFLWLNVLWYFLNNILNSKCIFVVKLQVFQTHIHKPSYHNTKRECLRRLIRIITTWLANTSSCLINYHFTWDISHIPTFPNHTWGSLWQGINLELLFMSEPGFWAIAVCARSPLL